MGFSLAWHIVVACLGVGLPALTLLAEWLGIRRNDPALKLLARLITLAALGINARGAAFTFRKVSTELWQQRPTRPSSPPASSPWPAERPYSSLPSGCSTALSSERTHRRRTGGWGGEWWGC
jgi:hypothetical protein